MYIAGDMVPHKKIVVETFSVFLMSGTKSFEMWSTERIAERKLRWYGHVRMMKDVAQDMLRGYVPGEM